MFFVMKKSRIVIPVIAGTISAAILLTLMFNIGVNEPKAEPNFANGELELIGEPYHLGDTIQIVGKVNDPSIGFVTIEILDSKKNLVDIEEYGMSGKNGQFKKSFSTTYDEYRKAPWNEGTYTARVTAEGLELTKTFEILEQKA